MKKNRYPVDQCREKPIAASGPVVRRLNSTIHWINYYPKDSAIGLRTTFPLESDLSGG